MLEVCQQCVNKHLEAELCNKGNMEIECLFVGCKQILGYNDVKNIARNEIMERYDRLLLHQALRSEPNFRWCKNSKCGSGQIHSGGSMSNV